MSQAKAVDLDEFEAVGSPKSGCWFRRLTDDQRAKAAAAHEAGYSHPTIARVVSAWGSPIGRGSVGDHFRGICSCD